MIEPTESESKSELDRFCDAMLQIRQEIQEIADGKADKQNNVLKNAPHSIGRITADKWDFPYSREKAAYPLPLLRRQKFWTSVSRVNDVYGDRNLFCTCPPEAYVYKEDFKKMYNYSLSLTKNEDSAYDLLQTSLEKFYNKNGDELEYPTSYLYRIIKNQFIDEQRRKVRWKYDDIDDVKYSNVLASSENVLQDLVTNEETELMLSYLKPEERELLYLWAVEGYTVQAISEQVNSPKGTILSRLHRIKKKIKDRMRKNGRRQERVQHA
ncbi:hypothetical protein CHS0354_006846 [Potamilus streckersoni]|uniref:Uncharacterized protein n=1 Tax=Potamilus streckersoni TaxID=2493646 RepID=A0AAE0WCZ5_9BIVA|nr:hypothetical protein CHS0354_006846 [Potamilus streckersoni]